MNQLPTPSSLLDRIIWFCLNNKLVVILCMSMFIVWGAIHAPFDWQLGNLPRNPVPVDAIPDIGENQQIVFTEWMGRSPQDVEDQITYPLTVSLLGIPGVKTVRSYSYFGFSTIYIIFKENIEFYWSRSRVLEKLNSLPLDTLPSGVKASLGPDATALGQIFWYTLEGREGQDGQGKPTGGWDLHELRSIQDWYVRYALLSVDGVSEVASVGGFVQEYQVDVDPDAMRIHEVKLEHIVNAIRRSNVDVGARTIEVNKVEYIIRGLGFLKNVKDLEDTVLRSRKQVPLYIKDVAKVNLGPALRRGALDKEGAEAVGGVAVVRYAGNPLKTIQNIKQKIKEITPGLPQKILEDGTQSKVVLVPFYDRSDLIHETLGTLNSALSQEILITILVILIMLQHWFSSMLISGLLPLAVLMCFIAMKGFGVDANIVALSGIAIAIGTMVDMGIIISENIFKHLRQAKVGEDKQYIVFQATREVGSAVLTAVATTIISFLPVFTMSGAEGKLFKPLAFTKTFALLASIVVALTIIPPLAHFFFTRSFNTKRFKQWGYGALMLVGAVIAYMLNVWLGLIMLLIGAYHVGHNYFPSRARQFLQKYQFALVIVGIVALLAQHWLPLGPEKGMLRNVLFVGLMIGALLGFFYQFQKYYADMLRWCLEHKRAFLVIPLLIVLTGGLVWRSLGKEFMPPLDEGSYLFMPTTMPHASIGEALDVLQTQDALIAQVPEVDTVVGKLGRADTPLDPAPISMFETIINYKSEYLTDKHGKRLRFAHSRRGKDWMQDENGKPMLAPDAQPYYVKGRYERDENGRLIPDSRGMPFRLWRGALEPRLNPDRNYWPGIHKPDDIWKLIVDSARIPGTTSAPKLQPIAARIVMLQSGMRAPMGIKLKAPDLETLETSALELEALLKQVPLIEASTVIADRVVGKPYLEIDINRKAAARYGISVQDIQDVIEFAVGGKRISTTVEGRERYPVRVRYLRERRDQIENLGTVLVASPEGAQIPLIQLADIRYVRGPQVIKSEDTFLIAYVIFDKHADAAEVDVIEQAQAFLDKKIAAGELKLPSGVSYSFAGTYENQIRAQKTLSIVLPLALFLIFIILYFQFHAVSTTFLVFSGILVAWAGAFIMIGLYAQPWFMNFSLFGTNMRELFQMHPINLSVAIWVGFLALFGIASDNGVVIATYLNQTFSERKPQSIHDIREATVFAAMRRIRPCLMTSATTILALLPVLTSTGRGSDIMVPMAIPSFGGMFVVLVTVFMVPVLYCAIKEREYEKIQSAL